MVYKKLWFSTDEYLVFTSIPARSSRVINIWMVQYSLYHMSVDRLALQTTSTDAWLCHLFMTDDAEKYSKMQHIFAYNELPWGATTHALHF